MGGKNGSHLDATYQWSNMIDKGKNSADIHVHMQYIIFILYIWRCLEINMQYVYKYHTYYRIYVFVQSFTCQI